MDEKPLLITGVCLPVRNYSMESIERTRTERLLLTRITPADAPDISNMYSNPAVMATLGGVRTLEESEAAVNKLVQHWAEYGFGPWVVRRSPQTQLLGASCRRWDSVAKESSSTKDM